MLHQHAAKSESLVTKRTLVRLFSRVNAHVPSKVEHILEFSVTDRTRFRLDYRLFRMRTVYMFLKRLFKQLRHLKKTFYLTDLL